MRHLQGVTWGGCEGDRGSAAQRAVGIRPQSWEVSQEVSREEPSQGASVFHGKDPSFTLEGGVSGLRGRWALPSWASTPAPHEVQLTTSQHRVGTTVTFSKPIWSHSASGDF